MTGEDGSGEFHIFMVSTLTADPACSVRVAKLPWKTHFVVGMEKKKKKKTDFKTTADPEK